MAHGLGAHAEQVARAALAAADAVARVDDERAAVYTTVILRAVSAAMRARLEDEMHLGKFPELTGLEKRILARGKAEGLVEGEARGKAEGKAEGVLAVLAARGIEVSEAARARVLACSDTTELDAWLARSATAEFVEDVFGANGASS